MLRVTRHSSTQVKPVGATKGCLLASGHLLDVSKVCHNSPAGDFGENHKVLWGNGVGEIRTHGTRKGTLVFKFARRVFV